MVDLGGRGDKLAAQQSQEQQQQGTFCVGHARGGGGMMIACPLLSDDGHQKLKHTTISHQNGNQPPKWRPSDGSERYHCPTVTFACMRGAAAKDGFDGTQDKSCMLQYSCDKLIESINLFTLPPHTTTPPCSPTAIRNLPAFPNHALLTPFPSVTCHILPHHVNQHHSLTICCAGDHPG